MYQYRAKIVKIIDGDTVDVDIDLGFSVILSKQRIRLYGIDTPESRTRNLDEKKYGLLAKNFLKEFIGKAGNHLIVETCKDDRGKFGRILGKLINKDNDSKELIRRIEEKIIGCLFVLSDPVKGSPIALSYDEKNKNIVFEVFGEFVSISNTISVDVFMELNPSDIVNLGHSMTKDFLKDKEKQKKPFLRIVGG